MSWCSRDSSSNRLPIPHITSSLENREKRIVHQDDDHHHLLCVHLDGSAAAAAAFPSELPFVPFLLLCMSLESLPPPGVGLTERRRKICWANQKENHLLIIIMTILTLNSMPAATHKRGTGTRIMMIIMSCITLFKWRSVESVERGAKSKRDDVRRERKEGHKTKSGEETASRVFVFDSRISWSHLLSDFSGGNGNNYENDEVTRDIISYSRFQGMVIEKRPLISDQGLLFLT